MFQSPPHRGIRFNVIRTMSRCAKSRRFSPLLIGESGSTNRALALPSAKLSTFQSPPHRGIRFNSRRSAIRHPSYRVSVPSSSGNPVQLHTSIRVLRQKHRFQSPPHRGIRFNVSASVLTVAFPEAFQSPPHRGIRFNRPICVVKSKTFAASKMPFFRNSLDAFKLPLICEIPYHMSSQ